MGRGLGWCYYRCDGPGEHDWEDGQDPRRRHLRFLESVLLLWVERGVVKQGQSVGFFWIMFQNQIWVQIQNASLGCVDVLECSVKGLPVKRRWY